MLGTTVCTLAAAKGCLSFSCSFSYVGTDAASSSRRTRSRWSPPALRRGVGLGYANADEGQFITEGLKPTHSIEVFFLVFGGVTVLFFLMNVLVLWVVPMTVNSITGLLS